MTPQPQQEYIITEEHLQNFRRGVITFEDIEDFARWHPHTPASEPAQEESDGGHRCICHWYDDYNTPPCARAKTLKEYELYEVGRTDGATAAREKVVNGVQQIIKQAIQWDISDNQYVMIEDIDYRIESLRQEEP